MLSKVLGDKKTLILGWTSSILGAFNILFSSDNVQALCQNIGWCLDGNAWWGTLLTIIGQLTIAARYATGQKYGDPNYK